MLSWMKMRFWLVIAGLVAGALLFMAISNYYYKRENKDLLTENIVQQTVNENLERTVDRMQTSQEVTDRILTEATEKIIADNKQEEVIKGTVERRIREIRSGQRPRVQPTATQHRQSEPVTVSDASEVKPSSAKQTAEQQAVSRVYIDGVWAAYCLSVEQNDERCTANPNEGVE